MARVVKEEEYTARRNEILDVALQLLYSKGYDKMTIQDILDQLQISKGAFYHYFDSKTAVLEALVERMAAEQVKPAFLAIVKDPQLTALEKLHRYFELSTRWKTSKKELLTELVKIWYSDENALAREKMAAKTVEHLGPFFTEIIQQGVREGIFTTPYPEVINHIMIHLINDLAYISGQLLVEKDTQQDDVLPRATILFKAYGDVLERILGAPKGSIDFMAEDVLKAWFSADSPRVTK